MSDKVAVKYFDIPDLYVELDSQTVYSIAETNKFQEYCKEHYNPNTIRFYFTDFSGRRVSPRWIITYLFHTGNELVKPLGEDVKVEVYSHTNSAKKIFNMIGIMIEEKKGKS